MKNPLSPEKDPKKLLRQAEKAAAAGEMKKSLEIFESCVRAYLHRKMPFKALAAAKVAKTIFGNHPKVHALLIRLLRTMDLQGDLREEYRQSSTALKKDAVVIFRGLTREEFIELLDIMDIFQVKKSQYIFRQHDVGEDIYIVIDGAVGVYRNNTLVTVLSSGDVFGELGFFFQASRSASVKALVKCRISRISAAGLRPLCRRFPGLRQSLEALYHERILKKAGEELLHHPLADLRNDMLTIARFHRGQALSFDDEAYVTIIKHGIVEVDMDERGLKTKRFLRPGHVIERFGGSARANTDVEVIRARINLTGAGRD
ncbi:MAG TPA: cyclic nucleotide-binding domain-containing protein [Deltaproteobacteria bacterium]|jgi:CRP-like cAMP-binding protein|nr:cyclic nucleotide-binding domain-containing protein [Pseudomonadota bacterium]HOD71254.1 cyclic nucleotide-binding domain-containing protein [Deltaproteobacteria bacterium]HRR21443.1 cyclic nucleotide-binding domain-containing protein [Desulfomonilia bacterium]HPX48920.1 cyclic nucleotide-binding domain-containing protein [Deltaproteobacteria bacterium]HQA70346.1 cyclic nucleotide-binding domain-containing protein [Deltaproteobacteria bacterium]